MSGLLLPIYIVVFGALIYFVGIRPQQKRRKEMEAILSRLAAGDEIITVGGIYGTVTEIEPGGTILLEVAENTDIRIAQASVARVVSGSAAVEDVAEPSSSDEG
jgi:preprotein translocase subunit YajC